MERFKSSRLSQMLARILVVLTVFQVFVLSPGRVAAQTPGTTASVNTRYVAVIDFTDSGHSNWPLIGRDAAAAIFNEIKAQHAQGTSPNDWDVIPREAVVTAMDQAHPPLPLNADSVRQLGQALQRNGYPVSYVLTGDVKSVQLQHGKKASTTLEVLAYDVTSGNLVNGALVTQGSQLQFGASDEMLVNQALENAAFDAVDRMSKFALPTGVIMTVNENQADISLGQSSGVRPGTEFVVTRGAEGYPEQYVGKLLVQDVDTSSSRARIVENQAGISPQDHVRQVFTIADIEHVGPRGGAPSRGQRINPWMMVIGVLALVGVIAIASNKQQQTLATPTGVQAVVTQLNGNAAVRVTWSDNAPFPVTTQLPGTGIVQNIIEYNIYRNQGSALEPAGCTGPTQGTFLDTANLAATVTLTCSFNQPGPQINPNTTTNATTTTTNTTTTAGTTTTNATTGVTTQTNLPVVPLLAGNTYFYTVSRVVNSQPGSQGFPVNTNTTGLTVTNGTNTTGLITNTTGTTNLTTTGTTNLTTGTTNLTTGVLNATTGILNATTGLGTTVILRGRANRDLLRQPLPQPSRVGRTPPVKGRQTILTGNVETNLSSPAGPVTPINSPTISGPQDFSVTQTATDITSPIIVTWTSVLGADQYQVQVSDSSSFNSPRTFFGTIVSADPRSTQTLSQSELLSNNFPATLFNNPAVYTLYIRVGARNSTDNGGNPLLFALANATDPLTTPSNFRFIFSQNLVTIRTQPAPPNIPGGTTGTTTTTTTSGPPPPPNITTTTGTTTATTTGTTTAVATTTGTATAGATTTTSGTTTAGTTTAGTTTAGTTTAGTTTAGTTTAGTTTAGTTSAGTTTAGTTTATTGTTTATTTATTGTTTATTATTGSTTTPPPPPPLSNSRRRR